MANQTKKVSELTAADIAAYCRVDECGAAEFSELNALLEGAKSYVKNYTGLNDKELDDYADIVVVIFILCAEWYDNRVVNIKERTTVNPTVTTILDMHSRNLL